MQFDQHVFISYAHRDNKPLGDGDPGWVSRFHTLLSNMLDARMEDEPRIWRDETLQGNTVFSDEILHQIQDTAVLLSVVSPRYVGSEWCLREANTFCQAAQLLGGPAINRNSRVFKIIKIPPGSQDALPTAMRDTLGFDFYELSGQDPLELDPAYGPGMEVKLKTEVARLAGKIARMLGALDALAAPAGGSNKPAVYLAECSHDRNPDREALRTELESHGYPVRPDCTLPLQEADYRAEVAHQLAQCALSVHLVGSKYGAVPYGASEQSVVVLQNELAVQRARAGLLQRVVSLPQGTASDDAKQQAFIHALHTDLAVQGPGDLVTAGLEAVKESVRAALARIEAPPPPLPPPPAAAQPAAAGVAAGGSAADAASGAPAGTVYVIFDKPDLPATAALRKSLAAHGRVLKPVFSGDAGEVRKANEQWLIECDTVLIYYGSGSDAWKASVDSELRKAVALRGGRPFGAVVTWLAGPASDDKADLVDTGGAAVIDGQAGFSDALLAPLLARLGSAGPQPASAQPAMPAGPAAGADRHG